MTNGRIAVKTYLTAEQKEGVERAAQRGGLNLSAFMRVAALERAAKINQEGRND